MKEYSRPTIKSVMELAAPHTWPASVVPVVLGTVLAYALEGRFDAGIFYSTLLVAVFLQCAVNTINDYADFVKGTDTVENSIDPTDASLVYNNMNPKTALKIGIGFIVLAALSGIYTLWMAGWTPLLFGAVGVAVLALYSLGKLPISHLPLGEAVSGFTMGILITVACHYVQASRLDMRVVLFSLPAFLTIALIMMVNNTSDIEKDETSGRRTLPVILGRSSAQKLIRGAILAAIVLILIAAYVWFRSGMFLVPLMLFMTARAAFPLFKNPVDPAARMRSMAAVVRTHTISNAFFIIMIAVHAMLGGQM
ncbi:prenyltransferase [Parasporobacterium paucivorans]|uniref:1,4-dihydroxy-2-naphthoate prenyltransferase n=1 Tax=Parasporobacterium paucivorans DSM 15970 TaxID=1122934 RepID=A0A1M6DHY8_9FIRM|nr:prenyltransferase [Parasporobacterium paucivorans]SHI72802.1 1,4-dihydroxy-2-naphthoate prenyltransferase [Parasporobacterium paucivorans DSM 15970]